MLRRLIVNMPGDIFCRWIQLIERSKLIQVFMIHGLNDGRNRLLKVNEIVEQAGRIELPARESYSYFIIVPVQILTFPVVLAKIVGGGKCFINADFVHGDAPEPEAP